MQIRAFIQSGAEESRTPDLVIANDALYQLSYRPITLNFPKIAIDQGVGSIAPQLPLVKRGSLGTRLLLRNESQQTASKWYHNSQIPSDAREQNYD